MSALKRALRGALSPWALSLGQAVGSPRLIETAVRLDSMNLKAKMLASSVRGKSTETAARLSIAAHLCLETREADDLILRLVSISRAQLLQDIFAILASDAKCRGYFVEVGVGDGTRLSNTKMLEENFEWSGLLVEPNRDSHASIRANRTAKLAVEAAYARGGEKVAFSSRTDVSERSGISSHLENSQVSEKVETYNVMTAKLDELLTLADAPTSIDFMSIDTEGSELEVLEGLSLDRWRIGAFTVEHNHKPGKIPALDRMILPFGYKRIFESISQFDAWYVHHSCTSKYL
jgi:FkbM family methyltransferase